MWLHGAAPVDDIHIGRAGIGVEAADLNQRAIAAFGGALVKDVDWSTAGTYLMLAAGVVTSLLGTALGYGWLSHKVRTQKKKSEATDTALVDLRREISAHREHVAGTMVDRASQDKLEERIFDALRAFQASLETRFDTGIQRLTDRLDRLVGPTHRQQ